MFTASLRLLLTALVLTGVALFTANFARAATGTVTVGQTVTFSVSADGSTPFTYQWRKNAATIAGATAATYVISSAQLTDAATYSAVVSNSAGSATSDDVTLTVTTVPATDTTPPTISITAPQNGQSFASAAITVSGTASDNIGVTLVQVQLNGGAWQTATGTTSWSLPVTLAGGTNTIQASSEDAAGNISAVPSVTVSCTLAPPPSPPTAPSANAATTITSSGFTANWSSVGNATGYHIDVSTSSSFSSFLSAYHDLDAGSATSVSVTGLNAGTTYYYQVRANNSAGTSGNSNTVSTVTGAASQIPQSAVTITSATTGTVGTAYTATAAGGSGTGSLVWTLGPGSTASGAAINSSTGTITANSTGTVVINVYRTSDTTYLPSATTANFTITFGAAPATMINPATTTVSATAQIYAITVTSNISWTASSNQAWATVSPTSGSNNGTVTVTVAANTSAGGRSATITIGGQTNTLTQTGTGTIIITLPLTVTTLAGYPLSNGSIDGIGSSARFYYPTGIAADNAGNLYVSDTDNNTIRKIVASTGQVTTIAGLAATPGSTDGTGSAALFNKPSGVAIDNLGVAIDNAGNVFVADTLNHTLRKITSLNSVSTIAGSTGQGGSTDGSANAARFQGPQGLAFFKVTSATGTESYLFIADTNNQTIRKINLTTGLVTTVAGLAGNSGSTDGMGASARFNYPTDVAVDSNGNLFVADSDNHTIREILPSGLVSTLAGQAQRSGSADGTGSAARFNSPSAVAVDLSQNVYVADTDNNTIRMIIPLTGVVSTLAGLAGTSGSTDGLGSAVRFYNPTGITVDSNDNLYVADTNNHTIRVGLLPSMPAIQTQPQSQSAAVGNGVQFSVTATGRPGVTYQWYFNGAAITGATNSTYSLLSAQSGNAGNYTVVVSNLVGFVTSNPATLTVSTAATSTPANTGSSSNGNGSSGGGGGSGGAPSMWFYGALLVLILIRRFQKPSTTSATTEAQ